MKKLTNKQKKVLKLHSQGKNIGEIIEETGLGYTSVKYALESGKSKLENAIEIIKFAIENDVLDDEQVLALKARLEAPLILKQRVALPGNPGT